ncbi:MAG: lytic transglycosylase domain-containing protein [Desulfohalobiaceae bacterium]
MQNPQRVCQTRPGAAVLGCLLLALFLSTGASAGEQAKSEEYLRGMVHSAQYTLNQGKSLYQEGEKQQARALFSQCRRLLLRADDLAGPELQQRMDNIFERFYQEMSELDPQIGRQYAQIEEQVEDTYREKPVYAGQVRYFVDYLLENKKEFLKNSFRRAYKYMPMISREFSQAGIPEDLAYMALIESGFRPYPESHANAKGLWQFIPETARRYGLQVGDGVDEREDPVKSTRAAAQYLTFLHEKFGDWPLAVAAYNCGEGRVARALEEHDADSYWDLVEREGLPLETQRYVPSIIAATLISRDLEKYGLAEVVARTD